MDQHNSEEQRKHYEELLGRARQEGAAKQINHNIDLTQKFMSSVMGRLEAKESEIRSEPNAYQKQLIKVLNADEQGKEVLRMTALKAQITNLAYMIGILETLRRDVNQGGEK